MRRVLALPAIVAAAVAVSTLPAGAAQTERAGWDYKGNYNFIKKGNQYQPYETKAVYSGGGSLKVCVNTYSTEEYHYSIYEWDRGSNPDDSVASFFGGGRCRVITNLNRFIDGSNGRAEFYIMTQDWHAISADYWD